jgi:hypothetical protein
MTPARSAHRPRRGQAPWTPRHRPRNPSSRSESRPCADRARRATLRGHAARCAARESSGRAADARDSERLLVQCGGRNVTGAHALRMTSAPHGRRARVRFDPAFRGPSGMAPATIRRRPSQPNDHTLTSLEIDGSGWRCCLEWLQPSRAVPNGVTPSTVPVTRLLAVALGRAA